MSWSRAVCAVLMLGLAACGYSPLYGTSSAGVQASEALQRVSIGPIDQGQGLVGRDVRVALMDRMNPNGEPGAPLQRLDITLTSSIGGLLVQPDSAITRYNYQLVGTFKLIDVATSKVLAQGTAVGTSAYNVVTNEYATVVARRDAERRAADSIGDQITLRVALYLKKNAS